MPTDIEQQTTENENNKSSDELLELKKELANEIVDKILEKDSNLFSVLFKWSVSDYLVDENSIEDAIHDEIMLWGLWQPVWLITPALKRYREMFSQAKTKDDLENLKTTIFNEIWGQSSSSTQASSESWGTNEKAKVDTSWQSYEIDHFSITVSPETKRIWENLKWKEKPDLEPFACAMKAYEAEKSAGHLKNTKYLTVVDFTKNQLTNNRLFVIDMETNTVTYAEKCGHGEWSGDKEWATSFSNRSKSHQSSLWAFITADKSRPNGKGSWHWNFPKWQESSNSASHWRWIARHPVRSLTYKSWKPTSEGCFTIPRSQAYVDEMLEKTQWWSLLFSYAKSKDYFKQSKYFQQNADGSVAA